MKTTEHNFQPVYTPPLIPAVLPCRRAGSFFSEIRISQIPSKEAEPWLISRHYAKRLCPISFAFGAWRGSEIIGVVTYGTPASSPLRRGICGIQWQENVIELNRLCCDNIPNLASVIVGRSLRMLPTPKIVVSYADTEQGHIGYVYQATNFIYTGLSAKRTNWKVKGKEHLHGATIADESRGYENRVEYMREKYGNDFYLEERSRKHRYVFFCGTKKQKNDMKKCLKYDIQPYPKGETKRYDSSAIIETQTCFF